MNLALEQHHTETGHTIKFCKTKATANVEKAAERKIRVALEIYKRPNRLNNLTIRATRNWTYTGL